MTTMFLTLDCSAAVVASVCVPVLLLLLLLPPPQAPSASSVANAIGVSIDAIRIGVFFMETGSPGPGTKSRRLLTGHDNPSLWRRMPDPRADRHAPETKPP